MIEVNIKPYTIGERVLHPTQPGRIGTVIRIDDVRGRIRIDWDHRPMRSWLNAVTARRAPRQVQR